MPVRMSSLSRGAELALGLPPRPGVNEGVFVRSTDTGEITPFAGGSLRAPSRALDLSWAGRTV